MRLTRDDERARRICSLALDFMSATRPIPSSEIARAHYPGLSADSFRRAFSRDRELLASCGVTVVERRRDVGESLWAADEEASFARGAELAPTDAAALELACRPLVDDPSFPLADELRLALAKLSRAFSETLAVVRAPGEGASRELETLRGCLARGVAVHAAYVDARGRRSERTLAPYGFFSLRGSLYLVAERLDDKGEPTGAVRTYRVDRFEDARPVDGMRFSVPDDFSVGDWRRLPFQMGPTTYTARLVVPDEREADVRRAAGAQGVFARADGRLTWEVDVSDESAAASWAVAMGVRPLGPASLARAWRSTLEGAVGDES